MSARAEITPRHRVLVVGCGSIGARHARTLGALGVTVGLYDPNRARAEALGIAEPSNVFDSLESALAAGWEGVYVCSPTSLHLAQARAAVEAGAGVLVEKPLALDANGVDSLVELACSRGVVLAVGYNWRCHPGVLRTRELLQQGAVGRACVANVLQGSYLPGWHPERDYRTEYSARRDLGGGVLLDASHELDWAIWLFGEPVTATVLADTVGDLGIETEDAALVAFRTADGVLVSVSLDYLSRRPVRRVRVAATEGGIETDLLAGRLEWWRGDDVSEERFAADVSGTYEEQARRFLLALEGKSPPACTGAEGAAVLRMLSDVAGARP